MSKQIFKEIFPIQILYGLLEYINAFKNDKYYMVNNSSFKKMLFLDLLNDFIDIIEPYYHNSKLFYINRSFTYTRFLTVIRQICNCNKIKYRSHIKYLKSKYDIHYYIYYDK